MTKAKRKSFLSLRGGGGSGKTEAAAPTMKGMRRMSSGFTHESTYNESKEWYTPRYIFEKLGVEFDLDPCSPGQDVVPWIPAQIHYAYPDGLTKKWFGNCWVNPPYGMDTPKWMQRLCKHGNGVALVFARCDTRWFHLYVPYADAICFIKGRIGFVPAEMAELYADNQYVPQGGCGAGSMLIAFGKENAEALYKTSLGMTLPVIKPVGDERSRDGSGVIRLDGRPPVEDENSPQNAEHRQGSLFTKEQL